MSGWFCACLLLGVAALSWAGDVAVYIEDDTGSILFGEKSDVNLYRKDNHTLKTDDNMEALTVKAQTSIEAPVIVAAELRANDASMQSLNARSARVDNVTVSDTLSASSLAAQTLTAAVAQVGTLTAQTSLTAASASLDTLAVRAATVTDVLFADEVNSTWVKSAGLITLGDATVGGTLSVASVVSSGPVVIQGQQAYQLVAFLHDCYASTAGTLSAMVCVANDSESFGVIHMRVSDPQQVDAFLVPRAATYRFTVSPQLCGLGNGTIVVTVTREAEVVFARRREGCGMALAWIWNGFQAGDVVTFQGEDAHYAPPAITDAATADNSLSLTIEVLA